MKYKIIIVFIGLFIIFGSLIYNLYISIEIIHLGYFRGLIEPNLFILYFELIMLILGILTIPLIITQLLKGGV